MPTLLIYTITYADMDDDRRTVYADETEWYGDRASAEKARDEREWPRFLAWAERAEIGLASCEAARDTYYAEYKALAAAGLAGRRKDPDSIDFFKSWRWNCGDSTLFEYFPELRVSEGELTFTFETFMAMADKMGMAVEESLNEDDPELRVYTGWQEDGSGSYRKIDG